MKKIFFAILMICILSSPVLANRILLVPSGETLTTGQFRAEAAVSPGNDEGSYMWLAAGLMQVELSVLRHENPGGEKDNEYGAQWSFLPETTFNPAVAFGVQDIADESGDGITGYLVATKHLPIRLALPIINDFSVTAGLAAGGIEGPFFGLEAHLPLNFFIQGEYDSQNFNAALGWQPISMFRLKAYTIKDEAYFGAELLPLNF
ncbi:YjbH domain-containing protein [bacterium]|nr:YjbH domain-containing protein [bacterium]